MALTWEERAIKAEATLEELRELHHPSRAILYGVTSGQINTMDESLAAVEYTILRTAVVRKLLDMPREYWEPIIGDQE